MAQDADRWMAQAIQDIQTAQDNLKIKRYYAAALFAQQAVEKALKAVILRDKKELIKTHDLTNLARLIKAPQHIIILCSELNPIYIQARYPDFSEGIPADAFSEQRTIKILTQAQEVLSWAQQLK